MSDRRAPIIAGVAAAVVCLLAIFFLVLPKRDQVAAAHADLLKAKDQQTALENEVAVLNAARIAAPEAQATIDKVNTKIPPTIDQPGIILLLQNAQDQAAVQAMSATFAVAAPAATGEFSTIGLQLSVTGTYFALDNFLYQIETLPRAAKVLNVSLAPGGGSTTTSTELSMQVSMEFYTSDVSAGPNSEPGPNPAPGG